MLCSFQKLRQSWETIEQGKQSGATADYTVYVYTMCALVSTFSDLPLLVSQLTNMHVWRPHLRMYSIFHFREEMFESGSDGEISQEVVDEQFAIFLSRDYASLLGMHMFMYVHTYLQHSVSVYICTVESPSPCNEYKQSSICFLSADYISVRDFLHYTPTTIYMYVYTSQTSRLAYL